MVLKIFNTKSRRRELFEPLDDRKVKIYICGPTVYNVPHIGHGRSYVFFDVVRRYLEFLGYDVTVVTNFTDTEYSITKRARELGKEPAKLAGEMIEVFHKEMDRLGVKKANYYPRVTQHIKEIIEMAQSLVEMGYAYVVEGEVFFDVEKAGGYGAVINQPVENLLANESEDSSLPSSSKKRNRYDFALWRKEDSGSQSWDSPWGTGRPGWHIECSAMATKYLGVQIDIEGGGLDLIFPHHECSSLICQTLFGKPFSKYYMHNGFITVNSEKMSKSRANFVTLREVLRKYDAQVVRFFLLKKHYREPLEYSDQEMAEADANLRRIQHALNKTVSTPIAKHAKTVKDEEHPADDECMKVERNLVDRLTRARKSFVEAMDDDFNTQEAIKILLDVAEYVEEFTQTCEKFTSEEAGEQAKLICKQFNDVMGVCRKLK